ncbi:MAG: hypothetical protein H6719_18675 [Sandaracinaceae bacterium]|nr:hypothetical protein [Sandaracinaceae bacterium]
MRTLTLAAALCLVPAVASADRVPPPPSDCPRGSIAQTSHSGPTCEPSVCASTADCSGDTPACEEVALCVESETYTPGGHGTDGQPAQRDVARGACVDGACPGGGTCRVAQRCVAASAPAAGRAAPTREEPEAEETEAEESSEEGSGGCHVSASRSGSLLGLVLVAGLVALRRRRLPLSGTRS